MSYRILIDPRPAKQLEKLPKSVVQRIDNAILLLSADPRPPGTKLLRGKEKPGWRIRIGEYRVLYRIDDDAREIRIFDLGHRRDVYR